ncbi:FkbM family methyltransferase [Synechococcus sp. BSF8S]|uniref:FkbM family methyltransferase n=1 Tax=Synechococcales TaxID=1890424 RepID=UPI001626823B|nr:MULTISPECIES: FkbM family methyltransferase [unclassified Synechococcus]MBC1262420.1 FkbM family methyltransferase [Synechococcus sp. BSF8S]MBC1265322.1 FkbM family methyltransferase [Synechococcus sp. BSA11S]
MIESIKNNLFKALHLGKGYPLSVCGRSFRFDESLRRFRADSEAVIQKVIENRLPEAGFFIDIGANFGLHTLLGCDLVGPRGQVLAVEPVPENLRLLRRNLELNGFTERCVIAEMALADGSCERVGMTIEPGISLAASIAENFEGDKIEVPAGTLDQLIIGKNVVPDLVKIDVEGAEHEVLKGAVELLKHGPPLLIEVHRFALGHFGSSAGLLERFLESFGYREERLDEVKGKLGDYHHSLFISG